MTNQDPFFPTTLASLMLKYFIKNRMLFMLLLSIAFLNLKAQTVTKTYTDASFISIDGCGTYCVDLPALSFGPADFTECVISDVNVSITWTKTAGSCSSQNSGPAYHEDVSFLLESPTGDQVILVPQGAYFGAIDIGLVTTSFDQSAASTVAGGTPVSGTFKPNLGNLNDLIGNSPFGDWLVKAGDSFAGGDPLCIQGYSITITASPLLNNAGQDKSLCLGGATTIGAAPNPNGSYIWSPTIGLSSQFDPNPSAAPSATTTYTQYLTVGNCTLVDDVTVFVDSCNCTYAIANDTTVCDANTASTFCIPLQAVSPVPNGINGMVYCLDYDENHFTPTGMGTLGPVVTTSSPNADITVNTSFPGMVYVSIFYTQNAPAGSYFTGTGDVACVEFSISPSYVNGTTSPFVACEIMEGYEISVEFACAEPGSFTLLDDDNQDGRLIFWDDNGRPIPSDQGNPNYLETFISGVDALCSSPSNAAIPDLNGYFSAVLGGQGYLSFDRDIPGGNTNGPCPVDVLPFINGMDSYLTNQVAYLSQSVTPNAYQIIAMDVNMDGYISANDVTHIENRLMQNICEFPQAWNYPNPTVPSLDWRFINRELVDNNPSFTISNSFPFDDGSGYSRLNLPDVPDCLEVLVNSNDSLCTFIDSMTYSGILLGDADGNWDNTPPVQVRLNQSSIVHFDLENSIFDESNCRISIPVSYESSEQFLALDFSMDYDENNLEFIAIDQITLDNSQAKMTWNTLNDEQLRFTSYSKIAGGFSLEEPLFHLVFQIKNENFILADLGEIKTYFNGQLINHEINGIGVVCNAPTNIVTVENEGIKLFPNPFNDWLTIDFANGKQYQGKTIEIYDIHGRLVASDVINKASTKLDLRAIQPAIYIVQIDGFAEKLVKIR